MTDISALPNSVRSNAVPTSTYNGWLHGSTTNLLPTTPTPRLDLLNLSGLGYDQSWLARDRILEQNNEIHLQQQALLAETKALCQSLLSAANIAYSPAPIETQSPNSLEAPKLVLGNGNPSNLAGRTPDQHDFVLPTPKAPMAANCQASNMNKSIGMQYKRELFVPNDLIGCIIGRGGNKINEIRQTSQANIKISSGEEGELDRRITITGTLSAVQTAEKMISNSYLEDEIPANSVFV